jgi:hypothetical protein
VKCESNSFNNFEKKNEENVVGEKKLTKIEEI